MVISIKHPYYEARRGADDKHILIFHLNERHFLTIGLFDSFHLANLHYVSCVPNCPGELLF